MAPPKKFLHTPLRANLSLLRHHSNVIGRDVDEEKNISFNVKLIAMIEFEVYQLNAAGALDIFNGNVDHGMELGGNIGIENVGICEI